MEGNINIDFVVTHLNGETAHIIGPLVKSAAGSQIKAGIVPVAGENAVAHRPLVEREAHVWTAVVDGVELVGMFKKRNGVAVELEGQQAGFAQLGEGGRVQKVGDSCGHRISLVQSRRTVVDSRYNHTTD